MGAPRDKRLLFVTGKGGVGKTTVAGALGLLAARRGRRTIVVELQRQDRLLRTFTGRGFLAYDVEVQLAPDLFTVSIDPQRAMEEYLRDQLRVAAFADVLAGSRMFQYFAAATPGMRELLTVGKVWDLTQEERRTSGGGGYDLVIVDAPATGHAVAMLRAPRTFADIARVGPVARQGRTIQRMLTDRSQTGVIAVALPAEMPVAETLELAAALPEVGQQLDAVICNGIYAARFGRDAARTITRARRSAHSPAAGAALAAATSERARRDRQLEQVARLAEGIGGAPVELPFVWEPELGRDELELLADVLAKAGVAT